MKENNKLSYATQRAILIFLHVFAVILIIAGATILYFNDDFKRGITSLNSEVYEDSPGFIEQLEEDITSIFNYERYKKVFEKDSGFNTGVEVFSISTGPDREKTYTLEEIIEYAKKHGYYISNDYKVERSPDAYIDDKISDEKYAVQWKKYDIEEKPDEQPKEVYMSLDELAQEVLSRISKYYSAYEKLKLNKRNLHYRLIYGNVSVGNDHSLEKESLDKYGKYLFLRNEDISPLHNLAATPDNIIYEASKGIYLTDTEEGSYTVMIAIDTSYPIKDAYFIGSKSYRLHRNLYFYGTIILILGIMLFCFTILRLAIMAGKTDKNSAERVLYYMDKISLENRLLLGFLLIIVFWFINEKVLEKLLQIFVSEKYWGFSSKLLSYVTAYICSVSVFFSLLRSYKAQTLWDKSIVKQVREEGSIYAVKHSFSKRLTFNYITYTLINLSIFGIIISLFKGRGTLTERFVIFGLICILIYFDMYVFHTKYKKAVDLDTILDTIDRISLGDTKYELKLDEFKGKELEIAKSLNNISKWLNKSIEEQVKSEKLKADLITNVSHDIRTPLTSIINYIYLMKRISHKDDTINAYLRVLEKKALHLKNLTDDLIEVSKASSGNMIMYMMDLDFAELVQQANGEFIEKYEKKELKLVLDLPKEDLIVKADGKYLWRVLENLYSNAYKYAQRKSRVYISLKRINNRAIFIIKNVSKNALNIDPEEITERFVRGDISRTTEGSGLGLSIAKSLTNLQNGKFKIEIDGDLFKVILSFELSNIEKLS